jgi:hypothetical protein
VSTVLAIGCTHAPCMHRRFPAFLAGLMDEWSPDRIVHLGDFVDLHAASTHLPVPRLRSVPQELEAARKQSRSLVDLFHNLPVDLLLGNHDVRLARALEVIGLPDDILRDYHELFGLDANWTVTPRYEYLKIDSVLYNHGEVVSSGGDYSLPAMKLAREQSRPCVVAHHHSKFGAQWYANQEFRIFGASSGCGLDRKKLAMRYGVKFVRKPILGALIIVDGQAVYPEPLMLHTR